MDRTRKIRLISTAFLQCRAGTGKETGFNRGGRVSEKCLNLNKYHIDARNLLGLIYYEMGGVGGAGAVGYQHEL